MAGPRLSLPAVSDDAVRVGLALILTVVLPFFGLILAGFFAWQAHSEGRAVVRNLLIVVAALAAATLVFAPVGIWWRLLR